MDSLRKHFKRWVNRGSLQSDAAVSKSSQVLDYREFIEKMEEERRLQESPFTVKEAAERHLHLRLHMPHQEERAGGDGYLYHLRDGYLVIRVDGENGPMEYAFHDSFTSAMKAL